MTVRALLVAMAAAAGLYVAAIGAYIVLALRPSASLLQSRTEALGSQYEVLRGRANFLRDAEVAERLMMVSGAAPESPARASGLRSRLTAAAEGSAALQANLQLAGSSPAMRAALADAAGAESRLAGVLLESLDYLAVGDVAASSARLGGADTTRMLLVRRLDEAQHLGLEDLVDRERVLVAAAGRIVNAVVLWVALGGTLLALALLLVRRRLYAPLAAIDHGLARVERGELEAELPVRRADEMGRLTAHFNQMTGVLRARADEERRRRTSLVERFGRILDQSFNEIYLADAATLRIVQANRGAQAALGYGAEEFATLTLPDVMADLDEARFREIVRPLQAGAQQRVLLTAVHRRRDGSRYPVEISLQLWATEDPALFVAIAQDATERRRREAMQGATQHIAEAALSAPTLEELYAAIHRTVAELMPARNFYIALHDPETDLISFPYFVDEYDPPPEPKRPGRGLTDYVLRTGQALLGTPEAFEELVRRGEVEPMGAPSVDWLGAPLVADGRTIGVLVVQTYAPGVRFGEAELGVLKFVSTQVAMAVARKRAAEALRRSEQQYRTLVEGVRDVIFALSPEGVVTSLNVAFEQTTGFPRAEWLGRRFTELLHPDDAPLATGLLQKVLGAEPRPIARLRVRTRRGDYRVGEFHVDVQRRDGHIVGALGIVRDITDRLELEEQFRQAQKMEAIGRLAGGVAHDFNNLLTVISSYSDLALAAMAPEDARRADVEEIRSAAQRATALTRQLLAFSRRQVLQPTVVDLNAVVVGAERLLRRLIGEDVALELKLAPTPGAMRADAGQLEQVLMNLAVNARDAMPRGGTLTLETSVAPPRPAAGSGAGAEAAERQVVLRVSDTGIGMDAETQRHIFEPFFTTKEAGRGTGLGLATVYGIVEQSGGAISVDSRPGHGATFTLAFPLAAERAVAPEARAPAGAGAAGPETLMLVEDDPAVRTVARVTLRRHGYTVLEASDALSALRVQAANPGPIALLVTDVVMPGMSGRELADQLREFRPGLRVLFVSGYADNAVLRHGVLEPGLNYLQKPFTPDELARKVREVLDARPPA